MTLSDASVALCVDLGKTRCRVATVGPDGVLAQVDGEGVRGAATADAVGDIADRVLDLVAHLGHTGADAVGAGIAGALTSATAAEQLTTILSERLRLPVAMTSDAVTAHAGALTGAAGVTLVAGTGAVALGIDESATMRRVDGWGPELGDLGGGSWIGREGIRAVLLAEHGMAPPTALAESLSAALPPGMDAAAWVAAAANAGGRLASFAPHVIAHAETGDVVAADIIDRALAHLTAAAVSAAGTGLSRTACLGGLTQAPWFLAQLSARLRAHDLSPVPPEGSALVGARLLALRVDLPHERCVHRGRTP